MPLKCHSNSDSSSYMAASMRVGPRLSNASMNCVASSAQVVARLAVTPMPCSFVRVCNTAGIQNLACLQFPAIFVHAHPRTWASAVQLMAGLPISVCNAGRAIVSPSLTAVGGWMQLSCRAATSSSAHQRLGSLAITASRHGNRRQSK